jgi:HTH-like domain
MWIPEKTVELNFCAAKRTVTCLRSPSSAVFSVLLVMLLGPQREDVVLADAILTPTLEPSLLSSQIQQRPGHPVPVKNSTWLRRDVESWPSHPSPLGAAMILVLGVRTYLRALLGRATAVTLENVALRHQLAILQRSVPRPRLRRRDRIFWVCLSRLWANWRASLLIVQPATVLAWHRQGFQLYWRWKSRHRSVGRPPLDLELRTLIRRMARENPTWGRRRIQAELRFLGYEVAELTVAKYMRRTSPRPSSTWRTFLEEHIGEIVAIDFFVVPTLTFHLPSASWFFDTTVANSSTSTLPTTPAPLGPLTNWSRASQKRRRPSTSSAIEMPSTATRSYGG